MDCLFRTLTLESSDCHDDDTENTTKSVDCGIFSAHLETIPNGIKRYSKNRWVGLHVVKIRNLSTLKSHFHLSFASPN